MRERAPTRKKEPMLKRIPLCLAFCAALTTLAFSNELMCIGAFRGAPVDSSTHRQYAPERHADILHLALDVTPLWLEQAVEGTATFTFKALPDAARELILQGEDIRISQVRSSRELDGYQNTGKEIIFTFKEPLPSEGEHRLSIDYKAYPKRGLYFRTAAMGYKPEDEHIYTQGEDIEARHWYPCYDSPNEKFTSEITCRVPESMVVLSNGKLISEENLGNGLKSVRWLQDKPHVNYLISLVAGNFKKIEDTYRDIPLAFYTPASEIQYARNSFKDTKDMMAFFEEEIGVPYPWDKYYQVCVQDYGWGGMENTSLTTLNHNTLHPDETETLGSSQGLVAHELAHQWFGDLVTCKDWSQIWLNEGFATYYAHLYTLHKDGQDAFRYGLYNSANAFLRRSAKDDSRPIVFRNYDDPVELFGYLVYPKGAWVLHMLRSQLGEDLFRDAVKKYLEQHQYDSVVTHNLISAVEQVSGQSWEQFFDQWVFHPHHPELKVAYRWDDKTKLARLTIDQVQPLTNGTALFRFPLKLVFKGKFESIYQTVPVKEKSETFYFPLPQAPEIVRLDPDYTLVAKIDFELPRPMLLAQLKDEFDVMGRIFAIQQLEKAKDKDTVKALADRLGKDPFYGVRVEAARALRAIHTPEALDALLAAADQNDARVRREVVAQVGEFFEPKARDFALQVLEREKNPEIIRAALGSLNAYPDDPVKQAIFRHLESESFRNTVASGAVASLRSRSDASAIPQLIKLVKERGREFPSRSLGNALESVAYLARDEANKTEVYELLLSYVDHPRQSLRLDAIQALGLLQDVRALPVLAKLSSGADHAPETTRARRAEESIRAARKTGPELETLRSEVLEVKRQNEKLEKSLEDLKKQMEAQHNSAPAEPPRRRSFFRR